MSYCELCGSNNYEEWWDCQDCYGLYPRAEIASLRAALAESQAREAALVEVTSKPGPSVNGCSCDRSGNNEAKLCPFHQKRYEPFDAEALGWMCMNYEAFIGAIVDTLADISPAAKALLDRAERLEAAAKLAKHKIEQTLGGQYKEGQALQAALGQLNAALAELEGEQK